MVRGLRKNRRPCFDAQVPQPSEVHRTFLASHRRRNGTVQGCLRLTISLSEGESVPKAIFLTEQHYAELHERDLTMNDKLLEWRLRAERAESVMNRIRQPQEESL